MQSEVEHLFYFLSLYYVPQTQEADQKMLNMTIFLQSMGLS